MRILAIETSCDDTAIAVISFGKGKNPSCKIEAHKISSQTELHTQYGGVFPMMAKREHAKNILPLFIETINEAGLKKTSSGKIDIKKEKKLKEILEREHELLDLFIKEIPKIKKPKIDKIAVTVGPGLEPTLWVGINFARALSYYWDIPIIPVNHMEGHALSPLVPQIESAEFKISDKNLGLPAISLLVSGGHTEIISVKKIGKYKMIGQTRDDAAGEAFDKVARMLELPYPGGPQISKLAELARNKGEKREAFFTQLPRPMLHSGDFDFSFSGLKTAVLYAIRDLKERGILIDENIKQEIALEFENATVEVLTKKTISAANKFKAKSIILGGGVSANKELRKQISNEAEKLGLQVFLPTKILSTDNAAMIGIAGYFGKAVSISSKKLKANGNMSL